MTPPSWPSSPSFDCPCGRRRPPARAGSAALPYAECCGRWHTGPTHLASPDAEALMRSRYSAFVLGLRDYLLATWHPSTRPATLVLEGAGLRWLGLEVRRHLPQGPDQALVEFVARSRLAGRAQRLHETSRFLREDLKESGPEGPRWYYLDGEIRP